MKDIITTTVSKKNLLTPGDSVLVALSGGADSTALLHSLFTMSKELGIKVFAAHVNHCIRGEEADRDEGFCLDLCAGLGIECYVKKADVRGIAKEKGISEELAGRQVRYAFFEELCEKYGISKIATAHNKNDNAETILMNFMRGSALSGLCGIPYKRGRIIRPLLDVTRERIEDYCCENGLRYMTDSTNSGREYTRNKVRLDLIPYIVREFNPSFVNTVTKNAALIYETEEYVNGEAEGLFSGECADINTLMTSPLPVRRRAIYKMVQNVCGGADLLSGYTDDILSLAEKNKSGTALDLPSGCEAAVEYGKLYIRKKPKKIPDFEYELELGKELYIPEAGMKILITETDRDEGNCFSPEMPCKITVRNRRNGDVFFPEGMRGRKKVKDYFIDEKIPKAVRARTGILTFDGEIGYIIGKRRDRRFAFGKKGIKVKYTYCNNEDNMLK
ncbi:MAG: tRNA lysidine(34) synthetase TilS [Clostridiales bacterium]|nr:tRNA lysidine(34) synthetase TilS [Clostridiales bacterium]